MTFPWSSGDVLTAADLNAYSGLVPISRTTVSGTPTSVTVSNAFSSQYKNYRVLLNLASASADTLAIRFGSTTTGYYWSHLSVNLTPATVLNAGTNDSMIRELAVIDSTGTGSAFDILDPYNSALTKVFAHGLDPRTNGNPLRVTSGMLNNTTSYTAFTFLTGSGVAFTAGGTIDLYGYNNA